MALVPLRARTVRRFVSAASAALLALVLGTSAAASASGLRQDLSPLFAPPTQAEIDAVRADWALRPPTVSGYRLEAQGVDSAGALYDVVSHVVDGQRHFAGIRYPRNYQPGQPHGAVVVCHGGLNGVGLEEASNFLTVLPGQCIDDEYFLIIPSYRGEVLATPFAGTFLSGGTPSYADRDVDDTRSLLSVALANYPDIDDARIAAWGISRGGAVALLLSLRDDRIRRTIDMFGFTDLSLSSVRSEVEDILNLGNTPMGIGRVMWESSVAPWLSSALTLDEARLAWLRRSPCYFATDLPPVQIHHGLQDVQVDVSHTLVLLNALDAINVPASEAQGFLYPNGMHGLNSLVGHGDRVEPFVCELQAGPRGYCGPMAPHASGEFAAADYRGTPSITENDFVFRANLCPPNSVGLVFVASGTGYTPSGAGFLCLGTSVNRLGVAAIDSAGTLSLDVDLTPSNPTISQYFQVGRSAYFQVVFRDLANPSGDWNFSNGLEVLLKP
ncbi:MAG: prolyl oligopeptidase family serine peptidase [Planctomycetota bacterium]